MADMIKFFKGLESSLPTSGVNGAIYITTDEGGIYLGTGTGMKRLGDFVQVANVASLPAKAHENCLYYCVAENILAKWNGTEWKQINKQPTAEELKTLLGLGSLAYKSEVAEADLNAALKEKVNAAAEGNHSHANKGVLDGITAEKVTAWDAAEGNAKGYADGLNTAMNTRVEAVEAAIGENGSVSTQIKTAIEALDFTDVAVDGEYVSAVNEVDGKISVTRKALPDYSETYDAKGAANTAFENAKAYADGLAANYDEKGAAAGVKTELEAEIAKKVDKVTGKSLVDDAEITKLAGVSAGANKVEASENGKIKIDGVDTVVYTHPDKHAIADVDGLQDALDGKQAAGNYSVEGHKHVKADITDFAHTHTASEITDLDATIKGYDYATKVEAQAMADGKDEAIAAAKKAGDDAQDAADALEAYVGKFTASEGIDTVVEYIDAKTANIASDERVNGIDNRVKAIEDDYVAAADIANFETKENVKKVADDLAAYVESNDEAFAEVKATAESARTEDEVNSQIDAKITALNLGATYEPIGAEQNAKNYVDQKFTDANLSQYTTEQEVKDIVDGVIAGAADSETYNSLTKLVDYIDTHGGEASEMAQAIEAIEGKVETIEGKPAYGITATQISNWDNEVGAKALAEIKLDAATFTEYSNAHAGDYTNKQIDDAIDADVKAAIDAEVLRADDAYDAKGAAADAQAAAIADAAEKYETKGTAQGIVDGLKLAETYEPIGAESRAITAAKTETENQVKTLSDNVYKKTETFTKDEVNAAIAAALEAAHTWGEF